MARRSLTFVCQNCGAAYGRWQGKCDACGEWNTIAEESSATARPPMPGRAPRRGRPFALEPLTGERGRGLDQKRRLADAGIAGHQQHRAAHKTAAGDAVELGHA